MFKPVDSVPNFPQIEESILKFWKENRIFEKSVESRPIDKPWTFLDGPPFVTGMPHYGSLLSSLPKDLFGRFWTMKGYRVRRVWGWDGHGLPIENKVEGELQIKRKKDIEEVVGVKKFIELCRTYVDDVSAEWEWYVDHIGRWVDFKNAYKTWDRDYMESVMWVFKQMYDKGYIYKGLRVSLYCPHCATPISNFEVAMDAENYKDITEHATTYKYEVEGEKDTYFLAWSTTPWTKIATTALAVNPELTYVKALVNDEVFIVAESRVAAILLDTTYQILDTLPGSDLIGKKFVLHYPYFNLDEGKKAGVIVGGDFVTADEGTGIVTLAVYGEEDLEVMQNENIQLVFPVDDEGHMKTDVPTFGGMYYLKANAAINEDLQKRGLIFHDEPYTHSVAHCWRCATQLFYSPQTAWYVDVQQLKPAMKKNNEPIHWHPEHFKNGRFLKSMEHAPDWNISRNRYWGSPVPVWECECGERFVPGSIAELEKASGKSVKDLHKPEIDEITVTCRSCGKPMHRTPEVLDSWIEAGSASFAERHYPFSSADGKTSYDDIPEDFFPPDFIAEYTGQIRAWFYVLHVIGTALYDSPAFKNVVVEGVILGTDGRKMSKNFKNYPDPKEMLQKYGGDALRLYLLGSPVMKGEDILISEEAYRNSVRGTLLVLWNCYKYFVMNANESEYQVSSISYLENTSKKSQNILDTWLASLLNNLVADVTRDLDGYDTVSAISNINMFIQELSTWYIRRSRDRSNDLEFLETLHYVLTTVAQLLAPITPFIAEEMYKNLTDEESVHLTDWPQAGAVDKQLLEDMKEAQELSGVIHTARKINNCPVKTRLRTLRYQGPKELSKDLIDLVSDEVNVEELVLDAKKSEPWALDWQKERDFGPGNIDQEFTNKRVLIRMIQDQRKKMGLEVKDRVIVSAPEIPEQYKKEIMDATGTVTLETGEFKVEAIDQRSEIKDQI